MSTILSVTDVSKRFGGLQALDVKNFNVTKGTVHAIIGPNGAGKSTFLNCLIGKLIPDTGTVTFNDKSMLGLQPHEINQAGISRVFQTPEIFSDLTILENVLIPSLAHRDGAFKVNWWPRLETDSQVRDHAVSILEDIGLADKLDSHAGSMSRGDKRRLEMAMCLSQDPQLLLLDEPTAGMSRADTNATIDLLKRVAESHGITKVIIEHDMHVVFSLCDRISVLAQGQIIAEGTPDEIRGNPKVQEAYLGGAEA